MQGSIPGCLGPTGILRQTGTASRFADDVKFGEVMARLASSLGGVSMEALFQEYLDSGGDITVFDRFTHAVSALDASCNPTQIEPNAIVCGSVNIGFIVSPISLDFGGQDSWTTVKFRLAPTQRNPWVVWKASATRPLLVYDPDHTGVVKDGRQLFGTWSFGGRKGIRMASLSVSRIPFDGWDNGYQPLAQLDTDRNGLVEGMELDPLALWFDKNQNAISEPGEVVPIKQQGIVGLRTTYDLFDPNSGTLVSKHGFTKRTSNGALTTGDTIDWFTGNYASKLAASQELDRDTYAFARHVDASPTTTEPLAKGTNSLTGWWYWEAHEDKNAHGLFYLRENNGRFVGLSIVEQPVQSNQQGVYTVLTSVPVFGTTSQTDGKTNLRMAAKHKGIKTDSVVTFDEHLNVLRGESKASKGGPALKFTWEAKRINDASSERGKK